MQNCKSIFLDIMDRAKENLSDSDSIDGVKFIGTLYPGKGGVRCNLYGLLTFRVNTKQHYSLTSLLGDNVVITTKSTPSIMHWSSIRNMLFFLKYRSCLEDELRPQIEGFEIMLVNGLVKIQSTHFPDLEDILIEEKIEHNSDAIDVVFLYEKPDLIDTDEQIREMYYKRISYV